MTEQNLGKKVASEAITSFGGMSIGSVFRYLFSILVFKITLINKLQML